MYIIFLQNKDTALNYAALGGHTDVVQVLLSRNDLNTGLRNKVLLL